MHEFDSGITSKRLVAIELRIEDEYWLNGRPLLSSEFDGSIEPRVILDTEIRSMPVEDHPSE